MIRSQWMWAICREVIWSFNIYVSLFKWVLHFRNNWLIRVMIQRLNNSTDTKVVRFLCTSEIYISKNKPIIFPAKTLLYTLVWRVVKLVTKAIDMTLKRKGEFENVWQLMKDWHQKWWIILFTSSDINWIPFLFELKPNLVRPMDF